VEDPKKESEEKGLV